MKIRTFITSSLAVLCSALATTTVFGQLSPLSPDTAILTWTGPGVDIDYETNWGNTVNVNPIPTLTTLAFNGVPAGNLNLTYSANPATLASGAGGNGYNIWLTSSQTGSVSINTTLGTGNPLAISDIQIDSGAGAFYLGGPDSSHNMEWIGRPGGFDHTLINNSSSTATIGPNLFFDAGAGAQFTMEFEGTGNWVVNNYLGNNNGPNIAVQQDGPGTLTWNPSGFADANGIASPITIQGGTLILAGPHPKINTQTIADDSGATFVFNAPGQSQTLAGAIIGGGQVIVDAGTLTLAGASSFTGNLTLNGGTVIADSAETGGTGPLGEGNSIVLNGGTLEFTSLDFADYSAVFSTAAGQQYNINANGQSPVFATGLTSSGGSLSLTGPGSLTLGGENTYNGGTTVNSGKLIITGTNTGAGNITVANSAALGVFENGAQTTPAALVVGTTSGATLEFNNVANATTPPIAAGTVTTGGAITVNINSGTFTSVGQTFPLFSWTSGSAPAVQLGLVTGGGGFLTTNGNSIVFNVNALAYNWTGGNNANWDTSTTGNWLANGIAAVFQNGGPAVFNDNATGSTTVDINGLVSPSSTTFSDNKLAYNLNSTSSDYITGTGTLIKQGTNVVTISGGYDNNTGATSLLGGTVSVSTLANGSLPSDIGAANNTAASLLLNGGGLQYTGGGATIDRLFSLGTSGGTLDGSGSGALVLDNTGVIALSGSGARVLTLEGDYAGTNIIAGVLGDSGGATQLAVSGTTTWALTANNTNTGLVTINPGATLDVGLGGATGSLAGSVKDNGALVFNNTGTISNAAISGTGSVTINDGTVVLTANNTYNGGTTVNGTLQVGTGGATGALFDAGNLVNNGLVIFDSTSGQTLVNTGVTGAGGWIFHKGFTEMSEYADTFSGWWQIDAGATFQPTYGNEAVPTITAITNNGTLFLTRQDGIPPINSGNPVVFDIPCNVVGTGKVVKENNNQNPGSIGLSGTNTYTGGTIIAGGSIVLGDDATVGGGSILGSVVFTNTATSFDNPRSLIFYRPDNFTFSNNITSVVTSSAGGNFGSIEQSGSGTVTITGTNNYGAGTTIDAGTTLQLGAGGSSGTLGYGTVANSGTLVFDLSSPTVFTNVITDGANPPGSVVQIGSGTLDLTGANTYTGSTTVSNGTLEVANVNGDLDLNGGTLSASASSAVATTTIAGSLNISSGTILASLNKSVSPSNTVYTVNGSINSTTGTLVLTNVGPTLNVGDTFTIFNQSVANLTIVSTGFTVANNLAANGSVTVTAVTAAPVAGTITATYSGGQLTLTWPTASKGLVLQSQTNSLSGTWVTIPGTGSGNSYTITVNPANPSVFYRLAP
jgi:fibronectin-binding autotransporter adhesin